MTEVPFAKDGGCVASAAAEFGERCFAGVDAVLCPRAKRAENADAFWITAGEQCGPRGGADGGRGMKIGEYPPFFGHAIEVRRFVGSGTERADIGVAHVVDENDDDVGRMRRLCIRYFLCCKRGAANSQADDSKDESSWKQF
jgi:hypothetical protein